MRLRVSAVAAIALAMIATSITIAAAEPQRGVPWPAGELGRQSGGNTYNCATHDVLGPAYE